MKKIAALLVLYAGLQYPAHCQVQGAGTSGVYKCPLTPLELHAAFFDRNRDGVVKYDETVESLRMLGFPIILQYFFADAVHGKTMITQMGNPDIPVVGIAKVGRHEGDTGVYDANGFLDQQAFDRMFDQFDTNPKSGALNEEEIRAMIKANKAARGSKGAQAAKFELPFLLKLNPDNLYETASIAESGDNSSDNTKSVSALSRDTLRSFYDGTLFYNLVAETPPCAPAQLLADQ